MERLEVVKLINDYIAALSSGDYSSLKFSASVSFLGSLMDSPNEGKSNVIEFLVGVSESV